MTESPRPTPLPFRFRYDRFGNPALYIGGGVAGIALSMQGADLTDPREWLLSAAVLGMIVLVYFVFVWAVPMAPDGKTVTVDDGGLRVGRLHLPAERIAEVAVVDGETATEQLFTPRALTRSDYAVDGRRIRWTRFVYAWSTRTAVLVRDRDGDDKPWWLLTTPKGLDVDHFVRSLQAVSPHLEPDTPGTVGDRTDRSDDGSAARGTTTHPAGPTVDPAAEDRARDR